MRFTWLELAGVVSIALAASGMQPGERGRSGASSLSTVKTVVVADGAASAKRPRLDSEGR